MKLRLKYLTCIGILILSSVFWTSYVRSLSGNAITRNDISEPKHKLSVFVNYAFSTCEDLRQSEFRLENLEFFLRHGVTFSQTANIVYGITVSGGSDSATVVVQRHSEYARKLGLPDVFILHRENEGYDFGAHSAMLDAQCRELGLTPNCDLPYDAYMFFNDGVRGPFLPSYIRKSYHWSQAFLDKLTVLHHPNITGLPSTTDSLAPNVALVGTSIVCLSKGDLAVILYGPSFYGPKVEGFAFAVAGNALAYVRKETTVFSPHIDKKSAIISGEYNLTRTLLLNGWGVASLLKQHEGIDFRDIHTWDCNSNTHPSRAGTYGPGSDIAPLEVIFHKARWHNGDKVSENIMNLYTSWQDQLAGSYRFPTKNNLLNQMANQAASTAKSGPSTLVSYVYGGKKIDAKVEAPPFSNGEKSIDVCDDNLDAFLKRGYSPNMDVDFVFTLLQGRQAPKKLQELTRVATNVFIHNATWDCGVDLCQHQFVANKRRGIKNYSEFIFLNCGARGPYGSPQGPGHPMWHEWYRHVRKLLEAYDAVGPTISAEYEYHLQTFMIAVSSRSIHTIDTLWHREDPSEELVLTKLHQLNVSMKYMKAIDHFFEYVSISRNKDRTKFLRIALGELGLSFALLSNGKKLYATCFDAKTLGVAPGAGQAANPTCCVKSNVIAECLNPDVTHVSPADCLACPQLEPKHCIFVKYGGDVVREALLSPWTYARVSGYDLADLAYKLRIVGMDDTTTPTEYSVKSITKSTEATNVKMEDTEASLHHNKHGKAERMSKHERFSCYVSRYPDIFKSLCNLRSLECDWRKIAAHWTRTGRKVEHRMLECDGQVSSGVASFKAPPLRKWVFVINSDTDSRVEMIKVAVLSAKNFTSLTPVAVVTGATPATSAIVKWLKCMGVIIIMHSPVWADAISTGQRYAIERGLDRTVSPLYSNKSQMVASFLKLDLPSLGFTDDYILYTDVDVIFTDDVKTTDFGTVMPRYFTLGAESKKNDSGNTGVMLVNIRNMRNRYNELIEWAFSSDNLAKGLSWGNEPGGQGALKTFFAGTYLVLEEPLFNWKPYWGFNPHAKLIHFHGPKASDYAKYFKSGDAPALIKGLLSQCKAASHCKRYQDMYMNWAKEVLRIRTCH